MRQTMLSILGWYGALTIVLAYFLVSFKVVRADSAAYQLLNLTGALGIVSISLQKRAYQPAFLNIVWTVVAVVALIRLL